MKLLLYGANKHTLTQEDKENFYVSKEGIRDMLKDFIQWSGVHECFIYSSSFRVEFYFLVDEKAFNHGDFIRYLADYFDMDTKEIILKTYSKFNVDVLEHLYDFMSGMFSSEEATLENMSLIEEAIEKSDQITRKKQKTMHRLVATIIRSISRLKNHKKFESLFSEDVEAFIRNLVNQFETIKDRRIVLLGKKSDVIPSAKHLYRMGFSHITLVENAGEILTEELDQLNHWGKYYEQEYATRSFFVARQDQAAFALASADGLVVKESFEDAFPEDLDQQMELITPFEKAQVLIDYTGDFFLKNKVSQYINLNQDQLLPSFSKQDIEKARNDFHYESSREIGKIWIQNHQQ